MGDIIKNSQTFDLPYARETVWPVISRTDWLNRAIGLPPVTYTFPKADGGGSRVMAKTRTQGVLLEWEEFPFEWLEPEYYSVRRIFNKGPLVSFYGRFALTATSSDSCRLLITSEAAPRNRVGAFLLKRIIFPKSNRKMAEVISHLGVSLSKSKSLPLPNLTKSQTNREAMEKGLKTLQADESISRPMLPLFASLLEDSADLELVRIRPLAVARQLKSDEWETLRIFLKATKAGLLDLSWEVLCPNCRSGAPTRSLKRISSTAHCDVCQIDYGPEFDKSIELKFSVNASVRKVEDQIFCLAGPGTKPHILSQLHLEPGQERDWKLLGVAAHHRFRSPQCSKPLFPGFVPTSGEAAKISCSDRDITLNGPLVLGSNNIHVRNSSWFPVTLCHENPIWAEDVLTAARISNWQEFRDLFSTEVIAPDEQIVIGKQHLLFTDLRGSTAMYNGMGDPMAYSVVREHFKVLSAAVSANHGSVVKTIGDAVMAVFSSVEDGLRAAEQMHSGLHEVCRNLKDPLACQLKLKSSFHAGPCLAVNANDKLDYFGTSVNFAARMVGCCEGGDLAISSVIYETAEAARFIEQYRFPVTRKEVLFRGFDQPHDVWCLRLEGS